MTTAQQSSSYDSNELLHNFAPMLKHYKDGRIDRFIGQDFVPASVDPETGVRSKDVQILPELNLSARIYLPRTAVPGKKLPVIVYFHGGAFMILSAFSAALHRHINFLVAEANVVAISVNYRLAPEHPLPICYEDSWLALKWVASQCKGDESSEEWIRDYADPEHVYFGGDSAGGNIAHHMALKEASEKLENVNLCGIFLNCPFFWGKDPIGNESAFLAKPNTFYPHDVWHYVCPGTSGCDDPLINPVNDPKISSLGCKRALIYVAGKDFLRDRGLYYVEALKKSGWDGEVEVVDVDGEDHCFAVVAPDSKNGKAMMKKVASFLNHK